MPSITLSSPGAIFFQLGPITIRWYGVMIALGFLVATWAASFLARRRNLDTDQLINGCLVAFMTGILGARLYFVALNWEFFSLKPEEIFATWLGGLSIHGGIVGALIGGWIYCKMLKLPFLTAIDIAGAIVPLAQAIGRWGNFFNSEAYGSPVDANFPIKLFIPEASRRSGLETYEYFHATFLYESLWNLAIFGILYFWLFDRVKNYPGMNFLAYIFLYSIGRLLIEPLRTDSIMLGDLPAPIVVSALLIVLSAIGMACLFAVGRKPSEPET